MGFDMLSMTYVGTIMVGRCTGLLFVKPEKFNLD